MSRMGELELRISDQDRERAAAVLHTAVSEGRLTWFEHEERLRGVYAARTAVELEPLLADLPGRTQQAALRVATVEPPVRVTLGKLRRRPDPGVGQLQVEATLGAVVVDLRDRPVGSEIDVVAHSLLGKVEVYISPGTLLVDNGTASFGKRSVVEHGRNGGTRIQQDAPVVRVSGHSMFGHVRVTVC